jgi:hypothetical protein
MSAHKLKMKSAPVLIFILASVALNVTAQIPKNVVKEFERIHPAARFVEWKTEWGLLEDFYKVTYTSWYRQTLVFNRNACIVRSESELPPAYIPDRINEYLRKHYPHVKYVVWDSFDEKNNRSYFVICNENQKLIFSNDCEFKGALALTKPRKQNLLSFFSGSK